MTYDQETIIELENQSKQIRRDIVNMIYTIQSGHPGGSLSIVEILLALYKKKMRIDPQNPRWEDRDRFVLSKGHCAPVLYAVLAEMGYYPKDWLQNSFRRIDSKLQGHPDMKKTPGVDMTTGSLGIGLSAGCGMALGARIKGQDYKVYVMIGDGELNEGQIWEAAKTAAHYKLDNLTAMADLNGFQNDGDTRTEMSMEPLADKWRSFGWNVLEADGHDIKQVLCAFDQVPTGNGKPTMILFHTVKCKGVSFMEEDKIKYHGASPDEKQLRQAMSELQ